MKFFFDNCISSNLTEAMGLLNPHHSIEHLTKRFRPEVLDIEWIPVIARESGMIVILRRPDDYFREEGKGGLEGVGLDGIFLRGRVR